MMIRLLLPLSILLAVATCAIIPVSNLNNAGSGSLRAAIVLANSSPEPDEIVFDVTGVINLDGQLPEIAQTLTITGPGAELLTIDVGEARMFTGTAPLAISKLRIRAEQAFHYRSHLEVRECILEGGGNSNGLLRSHESLVMEGSRVSSVKTAVDCFTGACTIQRSAFVDCENAVRSSGLLIISDSTFARCTSPNLGCIYVSSNATTITRITMAELPSSGGIFIRGAELILDNSIIFDPDTSNNLRFANSPVFQDRGNNIISSLFGLTSAILHSSTLQRLGQDPMLNELSDHGGFTETYSLKDGSPAIDAGNPSLSPSGSVGQFDQRGSPFLRVVGGAMDIGAFEKQSSSGSGAGDPVFKGFLGQSFFFGGHLHWIYHLFSDAVSSINALFVTANSLPRDDHYEGTVMGAVGLVLAGGNHSLECSVASLAKDVHELTVLFDGRPMLLVPNRHGHATVRYIALEGGCALRLAWRYPYLEVTLPSREPAVARTLRISWRREHNEHINASYLNVDIASPLPADPKELGGIIGMTADRSLALSTRSVNAMHDRFVASALLAPDAPSNAFRNAPVECRGKAPSEKRPLAHASAK